MAKKAKITVQVGRVGTALKSVRLSSGDTVADALCKAGLKAKSTEQLRVDGEEGDMSDEVGDNAVVLLVRDIAGGK